MHLVLVKRCVVAAAAEVVQCLLYCWCYFKVEYESCIRKGVICCMQCYVQYVGGWAGGLQGRKRLTMIDSLALVICSVVSDDTGAQCAWSIHIG